MWYNQHVQKLETIEREYQFNVKNNIKNNNTKSTSVKDLLAKVKVKTETIDQKNTRNNTIVNTTATNNNNNTNNTTFNPNEYNEIANLYRNNLEQAVQFCNNTMNDLETTLDKLNHMIEQHRSACLTTNEVNVKCTNLLTESKRLDNIAMKIKEPLEHFNKLVILGPKLGLPLRNPGGEEDDEHNNGGVVLDNDDLLEADDGYQTGYNSNVLKPGMKEFHETLSTIQNCILYLMDHIYYQEAGMYITSYQKLEKRALGLMVFEITNKIIKVNASSNTSNNNNNNNTSSTEETKQITNIPLESLPLYSKWKMEGSTLSKNIYDLKIAQEKRENMIFKYNNNDNNSMNNSGSSTNNNNNNNDTYNPIMECEKTYFQYREPLITPLLTDTLETLANTRSLNELLRNGSSYLLRILHLEYELYKDFFFNVTNNNNNNNTAQGETIMNNPEHQNDLLDKNELFESMAETLVNTLYITVRPLILSQQEIDSLCDLIHILKSEIIEGQLKGRTHTFHAMEYITRKLLEDVQERLVYRVEKFILEEIELFAPTKADLNYPGKLEKFNEDHSSNSDNNNNNDNKNMAHSSSLWYPTLDLTLMCLSKLYRCVDDAVFDSIAQQALSACTMTLIAASNSIGNETSQVDASLFLIKHLLILREQINPFELHFSVTDQQLDFSTTANAFILFLQRVSTWFSLQNNAVFQFLYDGIPSIISNEIDAKKDVEQELKRACESFILHATNTAVKALLDLLREYAGTANAKQSNGNATAGTITTTASVSRKIKIPFSKAKAALKITSTSAAEEFNLLRKKLSLFLSNDSTENILIKPALANIKTTITRFQQCEIVYDGNKSNADGERNIQTYLEKINELFV